MTGQRGSVAVETVDDQVELSVVGRRRTTVRLTADQARQIGQGLIDAADFADATGPRRPDA